MSESPQRSALKWGALLTALCGVVIIVLVWQGRSGPSGESPAPPTTPSQAPTPTPTEVALPDIKGIPKRGTAVLVVAERDACWRGYVGGTEIQGCGLKKVNLTGVRGVVKAGAQLRKEGSSLLEVYIVHDGEGVAAAEATAPKELVEVRGNVSG